MPELTRRRDPNAREEKLARLFWRRARRNDQRAHRQHSTTVLPAMPLDAVKNAFRPWLAIALQNYQSQSVPTLVNLMENSACL